MHSIKWSIVYCSKIWPDCPFKEGTLLVARVVLFQVLPTAVNHTSLYMLYPHTTAERLCHTGKRAIH